MIALRVALLAVLQLTVAGTLRAETAAENADAQLLFDRARAEISEGRYADACPKLERSHALDPQFGTLLHLAYCYEKAGEIARAWTVFQDALRVAAERRKLGQPDNREAVAQRRAAALESQVSLVTLNVGQPDVVGLTIQHDGELLPRERWNLAFAVEPGQHRLAVRAPSGRFWEHEYATVSEPQRIRIDVPALSSEAPVPVGASAVPVTSPTPSAEVVADAGPDMQHVAAYALSGAGIIAAGFATGFFFAAHNASDEQEPIWKRCKRSESSCDLDRSNALEETKQTNAERARVALAISGTLLASAVAVWLTAPTHESEGAVSVALTPTSAWISIQGPAL